MRYGYLSVRSSDIVIIFWRKIEMYLRNYIKGIIFITLVIILIIMLRTKPNANKKIIFVLGKGGVGKSTYGRTISNCVISLDEIVRRWDNPEASDDDYVFNVYRPDGNDYINRLKDVLVNIVRKEIANSTCDVCVVEAAVEDPVLISKITSGYDSDVRYLMPASREVFKRNMISRVDTEYSHGTFKLMRVWTRLQTTDKDVFDDYKLNGNTGKLFQKFMDDLTDEKYHLLDSSLKLLDPLSPTIVKIDY